MNLIVETDLGHDPDDFFAICYLIAAGVDIKAITLVPGDLDQIALANFICKECGLDIPVGVSKISEKYSSGGVHHDILNKYSFPLKGNADDYGNVVLKNVWSDDMEIFVIGPITNVGRFLSESSPKIKIATMQGGFLGYHLYSPKQRIPKFEGATWMPTFNLNGDRKGADHFLNANIAERRFVGKNVCHTVIYNQDIYSQMSKPTCRAGELFMEAMGMYLERHSEKKFHDPTAATCHLHPEIGTWVRGDLKKIQQGWGTELNENGDWILADIDYNKLWNNICNWK
jgi:pyrimidine-specific ribonucleoside hydrolase